MVDGVSSLNLTSSLFFLFFVDFNDFGGNGECTSYYSVVILFLVVFGKVGDDKEIIASSISISGG